MSHGITLNRKKSLDGNPRDQSVRRESGNHFENLVAGANAVCNLDPDLVSRNGLFNLLVVDFHGFNDLG